LNFASAGRTILFTLKAPTPARYRLFLIPCSCGTTFAIPEDFDHKGMHLRSFIACPNCGKRHDPRNRVLHLGYHQERFWTVDDC